MSDSPQNHLGIGLVYEDVVPLHWRPVDEALSTSELVRMHDTNEEVLRFIAALEEYRVDAAEEKHGDSAHELSRIEFKVNLLLDMVSKIMVKQSEIPPAVPVLLSSEGVQWTSVDAPAPGSHLLIEIYLSQKYLHPISLPVTVGDVQPVGGEDARNNIQVRFDAISDGVQSALEKLIFRQHRRNVAFVRRKMPAGEP